MPIQDSIGCILTGVNMKLRNRTRPFAILAFALVATPLLAAPADQVRTRITGLRELGAAFKGVNDGLRSPEPQTILIQQGARQIKNAATAMTGWFPAGSGPQPGLKTAAKPEIWTQSAEFRAAVNAFAAEANAFKLVADRGNVDAIRAGARKLGGTCKGCHDKFKMPQD
jgi:cytochrome c556